MKKLTITTFLLIFMFSVISGLFSNNYVYAQYEGSEDSITRIVVAEKVYKIALELGIEPNSAVECYQFTDLQSYSDQQYFATKACQYGYMGYQADGVTINTTFNPGDLITRAQALTILSRVLFSDDNNLVSTDNVDRSAPNYWAIKHANALYNHGVVEDVSPDGLSRYEELQSFNIMIDKTLSLVGKDIINNTHSSAQEEVLADTELSNALEEVYQQLTPASHVLNTRENIASRLESLLGSAYNSSYEVHGSADIVDEIDEEVIVVESEITQTIGYRNKFKNTLNSLIEKLRPHEDFSKYQIQNLIEENPLK